MMSTAVGSARTDWLAAAGCSIPKCRSITTTLTAITGSLRLLRLLGGQCLCLDVSRLVCAWQRACGEGFEHALKPLRTYRCASMWVRHLVQQSSCLPSKTAHPKY